MSCSRDRRGRDRAEPTGDGGFIPGLLKATLERGLQAELTSHLKYEKGAAEASAVSNSRNGSSPKTVATQGGDVELAISRDREGSFVPQLIPRGSRRLSGLDEMIITLYSGRMTVRDIEYHLASTLGTELSHETISNITDQVADEVLTWQSRPLDALYPVILPRRAGREGPRRRARDEPGRSHRRRGRHGRRQARVDNSATDQRGREILGRGLRRARQPRDPRRAGRVLRRPQVEFDAFKERR